jgi:hypothetical protein
MAISKAITFMKRAMKEPDFRKECYKIDSKQALMDEMGFNEDEFEDAVNIHLLKCQTYEEAEYYQQIRMWFLSF